VSAFKPTFCAVRTASVRYDIKRYWNTLIVTSYNISIYNTITLRITPWWTLG
jgi:hypothetical protein